MKNKPLLWLRAETKEFEQRTPLTPTDAKRLIEKGHLVQVESSATRIFKDKEYQTAGCTVVQPGSWRSAPPNAYILGIKELPEETTPIKQRHIYFAHAYKGQSGAPTLLSRFKKGDGIIFDLEYLADENGRRVAAFGKWAGFAGAALGFDIFCYQQKNPACVAEALATSARQRPEKPYPQLTRTFRSDELTNELSQKLAHLPEPPRIIIMGAKGRSGRGAVDFFNSISLKTTQWDIEETSRGGPFDELLGYDILVNCVFVKEKNPPFLTLDFLKKPLRKLSVIADVTCDVGNPNNSLPIYDSATTFDHPTLRLITGRPPLDILAIDHLPSLLPMESSVDFSQQLLPHLMNLLESEELPSIWKRAEDCFIQSLD